MKYVFNESPSGESLSGDDDDDDDKGSGPLQLV